MEVSNKTILVTGGGSGIGLAISKALLANGASVIITGRNKAKLEKAQAQNPELKIEVCDVTDNHQIEALVEKLRQQGGLDMLVNNAGVFETIDYAGANDSLKLQEREVDIDFMGPIRMVNHLLPLLKEKNEAAIANVSSGLAFVPLASAPVYCATKAGLHSWTRSLRHQLEKTSVKVFELMPPLVETEMVSQFKGQKMMKPENLASDFIKGIKANKEVITPGQSSQLRMMSRLAPNFIFKALNKQFG